MNPEDFDTALYKSVVAECDVLREQAKRQYEADKESAEYRYMAELDSIEAHFARRLGLE